MAEMTEPGIAEAQNTAQELANLFTKILVNHSEDIDITKVQAAEALDQLEELCLSVPLARANGLRAEFINEIRSNL